MNRHVDVVILESTVVMTGIAHVLCAQPGLSVKAVPSLGALPHLLAVHCPDVLIFDLAALAVDEVRPLVRSHCRLTFIGLDLAGRQALTFSSRTCPLSSIDDLTHLIDLAAMVAVPASGCAVPP